MGRPVWRTGAIRMLLCAGLLLTTPVVSAAHELEQTSATLVEREGGSLELRVECSWSRLFMSAGTPAADVRTLLVELASLSPSAFARRYATVTSAIARETALVTDRGQTVAWSRWVWPKAAEVQDGLRRELMSRTALGAAYEHASRLPLRAHMVLDRRTTGVRLQLARVFGDALVTHVRPVEQWVTAGQPSRAIELHRR